MIIAVLALFIDCIMPRSKTFAPLTVALTRGDQIIESRHAVHAVILSGDKKTIAQYGDAGRLTFTRSTLKPLQTVALLESGAAAAAQLSDAEIALACASHNGEALHVDAVGTWLSRLGLSEDDLECGAHAPYADAAGAVRALANNCSGKHAGMLTLARHLGVDTKGYTDTNHPVQKMILHIIGEMCGETLAAGCCGTDGCSAPNPAMPLIALAAGFATFMRPDTLGFARGIACRHIYQAMVDNPRHVAGSKRLDTVLMQAAAGKVMCKIGAEGTYIAVIPEKDAVIALKTEDGAGRAGQAALAALLQRHGLCDDAVFDAIKPVALPAIRNWRGMETGETRVLFD